MKHLELISQFREEIARLVNEVESSVAMGHFDINKICEDLVCGLFQELFGFAGLRNLNEDEKKNYPGVDLADDTIRVAIQVTSDRSLDKVKDTLQKVVNHGLYKKYDRIIIYVLTNKQNSYSDVSIKAICGDFIQFDARSDILDYKDVATKAANATPIKLKAATELLLAYGRGLEVGLSDIDFDPPSEPPEIIGTNLVEVYFPPTLYIAELIPEVLETENGRKLKSHRKAVGDFARKSNIHIPSDYEASEGRLITFRDLEMQGCPFEPLIEEGTTEAFRPSDYYGIDEDHERVFKSLLRFALQQKLYRHNVMWQHIERKFIFLPRSAGQNKRIENWTGQKISSRMVFERKFKSVKKDEVLSTRHFAFDADFMRLDECWYVALTTDWFFSFGDQYHRSFYGDKLLSGLKRMEKNRSVYDQFRFLSSWLEAIDGEDLFSDSSSNAPTISFASPLTLTGGRALDEDRWAPLTAEPDDQMQGRFGAL